MENLDGKPAEGMNENANANPAGGGVEVNATGDKPVEKKPDLSPEAEIRKILRGGRAKGTTGRCNICGKTESRNSKRVNDASPNHKTCAENKITEKLRLIRKGLLMDTIDIGKRKVWQDLEANYEKILKLARTEHDAYNEAHGDDNVMKTTLADLLEEIAGEAGYTLIHEKDGEKLEDLDLLTLANRLKDAIKSAVADLSTDEATEPKGE